jgi:Icc-related predicted phosphoesterase
MKLVAVSDTHGEEHNIEIPKCDIFVHCGDSYINSLLRLNVINEWLGTIDAQHRIIIAGNHDTELERIGRAWCEQLFTNAIYLQDKEVTINGIKFYGSPWCPEFNNWSFMYPRRSLDAKRVWEQIPKDTDILLTHCPPYGILDRNIRDERCGCEVLQRILFDRNIKHHMFGHIHGWGSQSIHQEGTNFYNVSVLNENYNLVYKPTILEV